MADDFDAAEERARLAARDLLAASNDVIRRRSITWFTARDEVDFAEVSRLGHYLPSRKLDDARAGLEIAADALTEVDSISTAHAAQAAGEAPAGTVEAIRRLTAIADDCEARAISLRL